MFYNEKTYYARNKLISQSDQSIGLSNNKRMQSEDTQPGTKNGCAVWSLPMSPILLWDEIQWIVIFVPGVVRGSLRFLITYYYYQNVLLTTLIDSTPVRFVYIFHITENPSLTRFCLSKIGDEYGAAGGAQQGPSVRSLPSLSDELLFEPFPDSPSSLWMYQSSAEVYLSEQSCCC